MKNFLVLITMMFVFNNVGAQTISDEDAKNKGLTFAKDSGVIFKLITKKDEMTGKESQYATQTFKSPEGATAEVIVKCKDKDNLDFIFRIEKINVPTEINLKGKNQVAFGRSKINEELLPAQFSLDNGELKDFHWLSSIGTMPKFIMLKISNDTYSAMMPSEDGVKPPKYLPIYSLLLEFKTHKGNILAKIPPYDASINFVTRSCKNL